MRTFLDGRVILLAGDCLKIMRGFPDASVDSVVTDPPYHLASIVKRFGADNAAAAKSNGATGVYERASRGFMGKQWDGGDIAFRPEVWIEACRVLKPGGHLVAFGAPKNYHRLACAIEDAGFEIRDSLMWLFGTGFPKSHDVSKAIDRRLGASRDKIRVPAGQVRNPKATGGGRDGMEGATRPWIEEALERGFHEKDSDVPASPEGVQWEGWGTALKPAHEPIVLARKPLIGTVAENVLEYGVGALNIDGCRVEGGERSTSTGGMAHKANPVFGAFATTDVIAFTTTQGRWPANVIHDGGHEVLGLLPEDGSRFFFSAKADADDRIGSKHPTVKPVDLMRWLVRLVTPKGGRVLDPFAGTGTTGEAAFYEGFDAVLIEREEEYQADIARRMEACIAGPDERVRISNRDKQEPIEDLPLFGGVDDGSENSTAGDTAAAK